MLRKIVGCFGTGERIPGPGDSDSDSSGRGCKVNLPLLSDKIGESGMSSGDDDVAGISADGGAGAV